MFTRLKYGKWGYMVLTAVAWLVLATLVTLFASRSNNGMEHRAHHGSEQKISGRHMPHVESTTVRYVN